jgi:DNA-binding CsgD family transcriptional regulator
VFDGGADLAAVEAVCVGLVVRGRTNREIAAELVVAERTAEAHVEHVRNRLGVRSRAAIAAWAVARGLAAVADAHPDGTLARGAPRPAGGASAARG